MKNKYKKLGALWRAPVIQAANVMTVTLAVIGMVIYVGLYNPRASLAAGSKPPPNARAAPYTTDGDLNGDSMVNALDLSMLLSLYSNDAASADNTNDLALKATMTVMKRHWTW